MSERWNVETWDEEAGVVVRGADLSLEHARVLRDLLSGQYGSGSVRIITPGPVIRK